MFWPNCVGFSAIVEYLTMRRWYRVQPPQEEHCNQCGWEIMVKLARVWLPQFCTHELWERSNHCFHSAELISSQGSAFIAAKTNQGRKTLLQVWANWHLLLPFLVTSSSVLLEILCSAVSEGRSFSETLNVRSLRSFQSAIHNWVD